MSSVSRENLELFRKLVARDTHCHRVKFIMIASHIFYFTRKKSWMYNDTTLYITLIVTYLYLIIFDELFSSNFIRLLSIIRVHASALPHANSSPSSPTRVASIRGQLPDTFLLRNVTVHTYLPAYVRHTARKIALYIAATFPRCLALS